MKHLLRLISLFFLAALLLACEGDTLPFNIPPTLTVSEATDIYRKGATISGSYIKANDKVGVEAFGLYYATNSQLSDADSVLATPAELAVGNYTVTLSDLSPSTTYYYATFVSSGYSIVKSQIRSFRTKDNSAPKLGDLYISAVTASSCVLSTSVLDNGGSALTLRGFLYKKTSTEVTQLSIQDNQINVSDDSEDFTAILLGLDENSRYAVCAYAVSAEGIGYTKIEYVTTATLYIPVISDVSAQLTNEAGSLRVTAGITSTASAITERGFVYSTETETPTVENNKVAATGNDASFTATLTNMPSDVPVYIRAYATTSDGIGYSETYTFNASQMITNTGVSAISAYTTEDANTLYVTASITKEGTYEVIERGFVYSTDTQTPIAESNKKVQATGTNQSFTASLTDLFPNQINYIRAYVRTSAGYFYGETFTYNSSDFPVLTTKAATNILEYSAQLHADIDTKNSQISQCGFVWSQTNNTPTISDNVVNVSTNSSIAADLTNLNGNTRYYYRPFTRHTKGISYGAVMQFTTLLVQLAELSVVTVNKGIWYDPITFTAEIINLNNGTLSDAGFVYSTNENPTLNDQRISLGAVTSLSAVGRNLSANVTYYVRAYATNEKGTAYSIPTMFTTEVKNNIDYEGFEDDVIDLDK